MRGALDITCASPCGNTITSPACNSIGGSPTSPPKQVPRVTMWYSSMCSTPGMSRGTSSRAFGASATHGAVASTRKNTAPRKRTARRTSDNASVSATSPTAIAVSPSRAEAVARSSERFGCGVKRSAVGRSIGRSGSAVIRSSLSITILVGTTTRPAQTRVGRVDCVESR
jgi:hypothetical protein